MFGDGFSKEVIKVKRGHKGGNVIYSISVLKIKDPRELSLAFFL